MGFPKWIHEPHASESSGGGICNEHTPERPSTQCLLAHVPDSKSQASAASAQKRPTVLCLFTFTPGPSILGSHADRAAIVTHSCLATTLIPAPDQHYSSQWEPHRNCPIPSTRSVLLVEPRSTWWLPHHEPQDHATGGTQCTKPWITGPCCKCAAKGS